MKSVQEVIAAIHAAKPASPYDIEDLLVAEGFDEVATVGRSSHRWYEAGTIVFKREDSYIGVHGPITMKSEESSFSDVGYDVKAFEMEPVPSITYKRKTAEA